MSGCSPLYQHSPLEKLSQLMWQMVTLFACPYPRTPWCTLTIAHIGQSCSQVVGMQWFELGHQKWAHILTMKRQSFTLLWEPLTRHRWSLSVSQYPQFRAQTSSLQIRVPSHAHSPLSQPLVQGNLSPLLRTLHQQKERFFLECLSWSVHSMSLLINTATAAAVESLKGRRKWLRSHHHSPRSHLQTPLFLQDHYFHKRAWYHWLDAVKL